VVKPVVRQADARAAQARLHAGAAVVADHHDVLDFQHVDGELDHRLRVEVAVHHEIGDVSVDEDLARRQAEDLVGRHARIGAADPQIARRMLRGELAEVFGIVCKPGLLPGAVAVEEFGQFGAHRGEMIAASVPVWLYVVWPGRLAREGSRYTSRPVLLRIAMTFQDLILKLQAYWAGHGCTIVQPMDMEMGAGTFHPSTFLRALGPEPGAPPTCSRAAVPTDGRYGENPNRLQHYYQFQVLMKPSPPNIQQLYLDSLKMLGFDPLVHDIRFVEDNWESPTLGAWGLGWEVW
jgi:hypothetical protein